ncbi:hypothetical protein HYALB_00005646 [Hymenoscyphus albidus]|uniref:Uncharacterized protein n=1 Tax=Hymenoscyphus albidus TaxID=595503 RepID=A0A9N9LK62_9HELO|nr:hypothetical protein HYALB_00005646 [Hymenoscyphus albidus]
MGVKALRCRCCLAAPEVASTQPSTRDEYLRGPAFTWTEGNIAVEWLSGIIRGIMHLEALALALASGRLVLSVEWFDPSGSSKQESWLSLLRLSPPLEHITGTSAQAGNLAWGTGVQTSSGPMMGIMRPGVRTRGAGHAEHAGNHSVWIPTARTPVG